MSSQPQNPVTETARVSGPAPVADSMAAVRTQTIRISLPPPPVRESPIPRFAELAQFEIDTESARTLTREFCEKHHCCILGRIAVDEPAAPVTVGMLDPSNDEALREILGIVGRRLRPVQLNDYEIRQAIRHAFGLDSATSGAQIALRLDYARRIGFEPGQQPSEMLDDLLSVAIQYGATDIHIETYRRDVDLRFRKDGVLKQIPTPLSPDNVKKVVTRLKVLCDLDIAAKPVPMDGRFSARYADESGQYRPIHFRTAIVPNLHGEDCVIRLLDPTLAQRDLDKLGMPPSALHVFRTLLRCPSGLILVTGPTGSGKTTTLYGALRELHAEQLKVCTVEDPIEYEVSKVNQMQAGDETGFADYARAILRLDPDVIMIGEIRDERTAQVAVRAASTGHLVLSTVHTDDAVGAVTRMRTLGIQDEILSATLLGATSQRLLRRVCGACATKYVPPAETFVRFYREEPTHDFKRGKGCAACEGTGYHGRFGIFEVFVADDAISAAIARGETHGDLRAKARDRGFVPLVDQALERVRDGESTIEEVERTLRPLYFV